MLACAQGDWMLIAKCRVKLNGHYVLPNEKFEVDAETAADLIARDRAVDERDAPANGIVVVYPRIATPSKY
jgi:hypothetical protein